MNHNTAVTWPEQLTEDSLMTSNNEDEFSNFLEFDIAFSDLDGQVAATSQPQRTLPSHSEAPIPQTLGSNGTIPIRLDHNSQDSRYTNITDISMNYHHENPSSTLIQRDFEGNVVFLTSEQQQHEQAMLRLRVQKQQQHRQLQQSRQMANLRYTHAQGHGHGHGHGHTAIPPTPNSVELHGGAASYPHHPHQGPEMYDHYVPVTDDQSAFYTPLVSPAVTPLETQFRLPEYTIPGEYFTPLTSPALEAQHTSSGAYPFQTTQPPTTSAGFISSPIDPSGNHATSTPSSPNVFRRHRRRPSTAPRTGGRAAKASPSIQAKGRQKAAINAQILVDSDLANVIAQDSTTIRSPVSVANASRYGGTDSSGQDSVSPEPISEPLMPPPALPQLRKSPAIRPQDTRPKNAAPATPATLMRLQRQTHQQSPSGQFSGQASLISLEGDDDPMEDVTLPEPVTELRSVPSRIDSGIQLKDTSRSNSAKSTPIIRARPSSDHPVSGSTTPNLNATALPSPPGPVPKKQETKIAAANTRKRSTVGSSHPSPALRPRISPNIQPLVRGEAGLSADASALFYGSKSNYQHILDGTLLPGVSYPETLAENLSSKRTNHKLAEQGRRNRINTALKEIESLLPPGFAQERLSKEKSEKTGSQTSGNEKNGDKEKDKSSTTAISKASTVEMAIDYIKALQEELADTKAQLKAAEAQLSSTSPSSAAAIATD